MFKLIFGFAICTFMSLLGLWLLLTLNDPSQRSTTVAGAVMSAILGVIFLLKFNERKDESRRRSSKAKLHMTLAEYDQWKKDNPSNFSASQNERIKVLPAAWFAQPDSESATQSWLHRNIHVLMFLSFLFVALKLQFSFIFSMPGGASLAGKILVSLVILMPVWLVMMSLAMIPFGYSSNRSFGILDLLLLTTSAAVILPFFAAQDIEPLRSSVDPWLLYYMCAMSIFGLAFFIRAKLKTSIKLPQSSIPNS